MQIIHVPPGDVVHIFSPQSLADTVAADLKEAVGHYG